MTTVVFGCPIYERAWAVEPWVQAIKAACKYANVEPEILCAYSASTDGTMKELQRLGIRALIVEQSPRRRDHVTDHIWGMEYYDHMSSVRNQLLASVKLRDPNWFFSIDSDIILPENGLECLLNVAYAFQAGAAAPLVDLGLNTGGPAWNFMQRNSLGAYYRPNTQKEFPFQASAIMAAMLIHRSMFGVKWTGHESGEDLGWADNAKKHKIIVDPTVVCEHRMQVPA